MNCIEVSMQNRQHLKFPGHMYYTSNCISNICRLSGFLPLSVDIDIRKYVFLCKLPSTGNSVLSNLYNMFGRVKVVELAEEYDVTIG